MTPHALGFLGTGKITTALVRGICSSAAVPPPTTVSPRNRNAARHLADAFPNVSVAADNQAVVDASEILFLAVRPQEAVEILRPLHFPEGLRVVSLIPTLVASSVADVVAPARSIVRACPLPSCAERRGPILAWGDDRSSLDLLAKLGTLVHVKSEAELHRLWVVSGIISPLYDILDSVAAWNVAGGVPPSTAEEYVAAMTQCICELRLGQPEASFSELAREAQTPGGLNEQAARTLRKAGVPEAFSSVLETLLQRFEAPNRPSD